MMIPPIQLLRTLLTRNRIRDRDPNAVEIVERAASHPKMPARPTLPKII